MLRLFVVSKPEALAISSRNGITNANYSSILSRALLYQNPKQHSIGTTRNARFFTDLFLRVPFLRVERVLAVSENLRSDQGASFSFFVENESYRDAEGRVFFSKKKFAVNWTLSALAFAVDEVLRSTGSSRRREDDLCADSFDSLRVERLGKRANVAEKEKNDAYHVRCERSRSVL